MILLRSVIGLVLMSVCCLAMLQGDNLPENIAPKAQVAASSEYSKNYLARFAVDGKVPAAGEHTDLNQAWCIQGATARNQGAFTLQWEKPTTVAEVVYFGRTAWFAQECWKDYEVYLDDAAKPIARGQLQMGHGPQRIQFVPTQVRKLTLKFLSSYGGPNPGASEIQVFARHLPKGALARFQPMGGTGSAWTMPDDDPGLAKFIKDGKLALPSPSGRGKGEGILFIKRQEINPSHVYTAYCEGFRPGGGIYLLSPPGPDGKVTELLSTPKGQVLDLDLSYDGREIVFSWKKDADSGYHLYRMNVDGTGLTRLSEGDWHDYNPCWLPDGGIAFCSTRVQSFVLCFTTPCGALHRMDRDGQNVRRLSANYVNDFTPSVLPDGRILYSRWEYVDRPAIPIQSLWTIHPDGSNLRMFFGNRSLAPASFLEGKHIAGTHQVICTLTSHNGPIRGALGLVNNSRGHNAQAAITNLTPDVNIGKVDRGDGNNVRGPYETPNPIDDRHFICSARGVLMLGKIEGGMAKIYSSPDGLGCYDGTLLAPRPRPPILGAPSLTSKEAAPPYSYLQPGSEAYLYLVDVYRGLEPAVPRGAIKALRVVEEVHKPLRTSCRGFGFQTPVISCGATYAVKKVWGTVPVNEDGSAYFKVPADRPLALLALDADGVAIQRMRSFAHFRQGETHGCIGCHEHRNTSPPPPTHTMTALNRKPRSLEAPSWGVTNFDYCEQVQPVLERHCVKCHNGRDPQGKIDLSADRTDWFNVSYEVLTRGWVSWIDTRNGREANILQIDPYTWGSPASKLTRLLLNGHADKAGKRRVALDQDSLTRIFTWIDLNVPYYSTYEMEDEGIEGGRRYYPAGLDKMLTGVWANRCVSCHKNERPTPGFVRITNPESNPFLVAPLARAAGGRQACGQAIFASKTDPDYQALLKLFEPIQARLSLKPRMDMPGAKAAVANRSKL